MKWLVLLRKTVLILLLPLVLSGVGDLELMGEKSSVEFPDSDTVTDMIVL